MKLYIKGLSESAKREIEQAEIQITISKRESGWNEDDGENLTFLVADEKDAISSGHGRHKALFATRNNLEERQKHDRRKPGRQIVVPAMSKQPQKKKRGVSNGRTKNSERIQHR